MVMLMWLIVLSPHDFNLLKSLKVAINSYGMHPPFAMGFITSNASEFLLIPLDWEALTKTVLDPGIYLQFKTW